MTPNRRLHWKQNAFSCLRFNVRNHRNSSHWTQNCMEPEHCPWLHGSNPKNGYEMLWSRKGACGSMGSSIQNEHMEPEIAWWIHNRRVHFWRMFEHPVDEFRREATMEPQTTVWLHTGDAGKSNFRNVFGSFWNLEIKKVMVSLWKWCISLSFGTSRFENVVFP